MKTAKRLSIPGMVMVAVFVLGLGIANANIIPSLVNVTGSGTYTWNYQFEVSGDQIATVGPAPVINLVNPDPIPTVNVGSFLTIYDFFGYVPGSCSGPSGWTCTAQNVGFTPGDVTPTADNASILNITWTHTSGSNLVGAPNGVTLTGFSAQSSSNLVTTVSYTSRGTKNTTGAANGTIGDNVGRVSAPSSVPEPVTLILFGTGLLGLFGIRRKLS
jgi:hypothetical protein